MSWDPVWEKVFQEKEWGKYPGESLIRFVARNFYQGDRKNIRLLEVGCGPGANIWYMAREGFDVYGIDGSKTAIERGKRRIQEEGLTAHLQIGDIMSLPYEDDFFDAVIDVECLCCNSLKDTEEIFQQIVRILKRKGLFYSRTFTHEMYIGNSHEIVGDLEYNTISDGPLMGEGFVRLIDRNGIENLYGEFFEIKSVNKLEYIYNNDSVKVSEWIIICRKKGQ